MSAENVYSFALSFYALNESGIALVIAKNVAEAISHLQLSGKYNARPDVYEILKTRNIGQYCGPEYGLIVESYTNSINDWDVLNKFADRIIGPEGPMGPQGPQGPAGKDGTILWPEMYVDNDLWLHIVESEAALSERLIFENGWLVVTN